MTNHGISYFVDNYPDYDSQNSAGKLRFYMELLGRWLPEKSSIFELGVGLGNFLSLASRKYQCSGCDPNLYAVEETKKKLPGTKIQVGSYEVLAGQAAPAAVIAMDVLEHIANLDEALTSIYENLPAGGFLIAVVPVYDGPLGPVVRLLDNDPTHLWKMSRGQWTEKLRANRYEVVEFGGIIRKLLFRRWYLHLTSPQWLLRRIGSAIYFVACKSSKPLSGETKQ